MAGAGDLIDFSGLAIDLSGLALDFSGQERFFFSSMLGRVRLLRRAACLAGD